MKFKSKIDWWFHLTTWFFITQAIQLAMRTAQDPVGGLLFCTAVFVLFLLLLLLPIYLFTHYIIRDEFLYIRCGFCAKMKISYTCMKKLAPTKSLAISCALSFDRLELVYRDKNADCQSIFLSPKNKEEFIKQIHKKNPHITTNCGLSDNGVFAKHKVKEEV